jgi:hypothetical protein
MDDKKKKRLAALKREVAEIESSAIAPKRKQEFDVFGFPIEPKLVKSGALFPDSPAKASAMPIQSARVVAAPIPQLAIIAPLTSPEPQAVKQDPIKTPAERTKIYRWPDGYYLANGKLIDPAEPELANAERFKIFKPPSGWVAKTEDGTNREYKIEVEMDAWDRAELKRVNRIVNHDRDPIIINHYNGVR